MRISIGKQSAESVLGEVILQFCGDITIISCR